jgi:hypothetical protein
MPESKMIVGRIETMTNRSDQVAAVMSVSGSPPVTFSSSEIRQDLGPRLDHAHWHPRIHRDWMANSDKDMGGPIIFGSNLS